MSETAIFLSVFIPTASFALLLYKGVLEFIENVPFCVALPAPDLSSLVGSSC
jgi:hypothetical protein